MQQFRRSKVFAEYLREDKTLKAYKFDGKISDLSIKNIPVYAGTMQAFVITDNLGTFCFRLIIYMGEQLYLSEIVKKKRFAPDGVSSHDQNYNNNN